MVRTEHEAFLNARPRIGRAFMIINAVGLGLVLWALWKQGQEYYRRWPSEELQFAVLYWTALVIAWFQTVLRDDLTPTLRQFDAAKLPLFDRARRLPPAEPVVGLADLDRRRDEVLVAYGAFLSDIVQIAELPLLADPRCAVTDRFTETLVVAEDARAAAVRNPARLGDYRDAVRAVEKAWRDATAFARRKGYATLAPEDQQAVRRAQRLLNIALDDSAYPPERREAMRKAVELLSSVLDVPSQAVTAIGHRVGRAGIGHGDG
jgi:hypothetical protein